MVDDSCENLDLQNDDENKHKKKTLTTTTTRGIQTTTFRNWLNTPPCQYRAATWRGLPMHCERAAMPLIDYIAECYGGITVHEVQVT